MAWPYLTRHRGRAIIWNNCLNGEYWGVEKSVFGIKWDKQNGSAFKVERQGVLRLVSCLHNFVEEGEDSTWKVGDKIEIFILAVPENGQPATRIHEGVTYGAGEWAGPVEVVICALDLSADLILLTIPVGPPSLMSAPSAELSGTPAIVGESIKGLGFPLGLYDVGKTIDDVPSPAEIIRSIDQEPSGHPDYELCSPGGSVSGMSGGAVFTRDGRVVGVIKAKTVENTPRCLMITSESVVRLWA